MVDVNILSAVIAGVCALLALVMLFSRDALTCALSLLGVLLGTASIYGLMGEHFIATVQLVVYAGAIMVLFVFSVMLLNMRGKANDFNPLSARFLLGAASALGLLAAGALALHKAPTGRMGPLTHQKMLELGGNTRVLAHALFTQHYVSFEAVSLALLVALVAAVTLAKRHID